ncbi:MULTISPECIES: hypothetical protein [Pasteurellaceae]|uniref:hypothetical protein n=2 Tax=Pasteurellales TaxID=135625 RepID=UPI000509BF80
MNIRDLEQYIDAQDKWAQETEFFDIAIFRCWIKFEKFLIEKFIEFSTTPSSSEDKDIRKLKFDNAEHFKAFLKGDRTYIEYISKIELLSKHIFKDNQNPFDILISDQNYAPAFEKLRVIRNHIAHESEESLRKYTNKMFSSDKSKVISPNDYLKSWVNNEKRESNYSFYIRTLREISRLIESPIFLSKEMV